MNSQRSNERHRGGLLLAAALGSPAGRTAAHPKACAPGRRFASQDAADAKHRPAVPNATTGSGTNLSDKLAQSGGVICPPNVDPGIKAPTPESARCR